MGSGSSKGTAPPRTWTGFKLADLERLRAMGGSMAGSEMRLDLDKLRPKIVELGEAMKTIRRRKSRKSPNKAGHPSNPSAGGPPSNSEEWETVTVGLGRPTEELLTKEEGGDEVQRLMGLFRKRQQEVVRGKAAPGRKALRAQGTGKY